MDITLAFRWNLYGQMFSVLILITECNPFDMPELGIYNNTS